MSENQNRRTNDFSKYDSMATEELEQILRLDAEAPDGQESDGELLLYVMEVLAQRKRNSDNPGKTALEAWESFQKHYLPEEEACLKHTAQTKKAAKSARSWLPRLIAAAAVVAVLVAVPLTTSALGWEDIWKAVAQWAKETFSFVSDGETISTEPSEADGLRFTSLQQALAETNSPSDLVPAWIPEGFILQDITVDENPMQRVCVAIYKNGEKSLMITVRSFLESDLETVEISDEPVEIYEVSGTEYYIFENAEQLRAAWIKDSYECYISGELTIEEIKTMIDSIGKG